MTATTTDPRVKRQPHPAPAGEVNLSGLPAEVLEHYTEPTEVRIAEALTTARTAGTYGDPTQRVEAPTWEGARDYCRRAAVETAFAHYVRAQAGARRFDATAVSCLVCGDRTRRTGALTDHRGRTIHGTPYASWPLCEGCADDVSARLIERRVEARREKLDAAIATLGLVTG